MSNAAIEIKGLTVSYGNKIVLSNIYLTIPRGGIHGVLGQNGAGKSTLFKALLELTPMDVGAIKIFGDDLKDQRKNIVYIPQKGEIDWQFPASVFDVVLMGRYPHKSILSRLNKKDKQIALQALKDVGIEHLKERQIGELSGGQQQRVFLARALCQDADLLLFDEPFVGVDITTEEKIIQILKKLSEAGKTVLVIHHDLSKVEEYFDGIVLLNQHLVAYGPTETTFIPANISRAFGGQSTILNKTLER